MDKVYTPNDVVKHFEDKAISIRPKKIRRIIRGLYPHKDNKRWTLDHNQFKCAISTIETKVREDEINDKHGER